MEEGVDAQEPSSKRCKTEEDEPDTILELEMHEFECVICAGGCPYCRSIPCLPYVLPTYASR